MGFDLNDIADDTASCVAYYGTHEIKVTFKPSLLTQAKLGSVQKSGKDDDFIMFLSECLVGWDVTSGKKKIPTTPEGISQLPVPVLKAVFYAVMTEAQDGLGEALKPSNAG
jgi:hypothetical protein